MTNQTRDIHTLLSLPRKQGAEEIQIKLCESLTPQGLTQFLDIRTYAPTRTGVLEPTSHGVRIHLHEIDEVINALEEALEDISRLRLTVRPKKA
jgi:hypothetical protein